MKASEFDALFESDGDITPHLDMESLRRPGVAAKRVNLDIPAWMVKSLDKEASRIGVTRQSLIKIWLADKLASLPQH